ncbi:hypothetical protein GGTG_00728 [Gaeumannomyces tritici R3-111a-1]|uniref:Uncharacterized protein n=1 Tax=Gaeumannomyces tritici (strain R3-111a-1) TaxID=644352 RepID=J3NHJ1_GAET3|nr:hypothetical protein GGTG_00728 [Gaeumannomyces tritici R3-111a-1]EJT80734.1 hypothetical protein GGTG_00728 [Gaeumannomyces tritici R3-111a-1]
MTAPVVGHAHDRARHPINMEGAASLAKNKASTLPRPGIRGSRSIPSFPPSTPSCCEPPTKLEYRTIIVATSCRSRLQTQQAGGRSIPSLPPSHSLDALSPFLAIPADDRTGRQEEKPACRYTVALSQGRTVDDRPIHPLPAEIAGGSRGTSEQSSLTWAGSTHGSGKGNNSPRTRRKKTLGYVTAHGEENRKHCTDAGPDSLELAVYQDFFMLPNP